MSTIRVVARQNANESSYDASRFNAVKHGILSKFTVLPWEDSDEYNTLLAAVAAEFSPVGPTEEHLVEEVVGIFWRKRRLRLAEAATFRRGLQHTIDGSILHNSNPSVEAALAGIVRRLPGNSAAQIDVVHRDLEDLAEEAREVRAALDRAEKVVTILQEGNKDAYDRALGVLHPETLKWWEEMLKKSARQFEARYTATADGLAKWIEREAQPYFDQRLAAISNRDAIREQVFGDSFEPQRLESLARYETHLDRKLERTLAMLVKLQEIRRQRESGEAALGESQ